MILFAAFALGVGDESANLSEEAMSIIAAPLRTKFLRFTGDPLQLIAIWGFARGRSVVQIDAPLSRVS